MYNSAVSAKERFERAVEALRAVGLENRMYCFNDGKLNYVADCDEELSVNVASSAQRIIGYRQSYDCPDAGSAKTEAYGAGGGGGYAPDVLNFAGKGGKGAPGAVIIEW